MYIEKQVNKINERLNLMKLLREYPDNNTLKVIYELSCCCIGQEDSFKAITVDINELSSVDILSLTNDKNIIARWCDMLLCAKIDVVNNSLLAYHHYIAEYKESDDWNLALRAFTLVKQKRGLYSKHMQEIGADVGYVLCKVKHPRQFKSILSFVASFVDKNQLRITYEGHILKILEEAKADLEFNDAIIYVEILELLGSITTEELKKQRSLLLETNADNILSTVGENTLNTTILQKYSKALKEIASLPNTETDKERISKKMLQEQVSSNEIMSKFGIPIEINRWDIYDKCVTAFNINSPLSALGAILNFPISPAEFIIQQREDSKKNYSMLYKSFGTHVWHNRKGAVINVKEGDEAIDDSIRRMSHYVMKEYLFILVWIFNSSGECDTNPQEIDKYIRMYKSKFIPEDRISLYVQGLWAGFMGDYSAATHMLLPQIENSFRHIAQQHGIITTQLDKEIQHENMMGGVLDKIKDVTDKDLWLDLKSFLIEGEGFRNQALHGLISLNELQRDGIYLWWLCLKMIYKTDCYFGFENND